jgi:hypothetical protein
VVPIASSQERIALTFIAVNGSSSTAYCESFQISAINVDSLHCSGGAGWVPEHPLTETEKLLDCEVTWKMRPRDSYSLPPLHFENLSNGVIGVFSLSARAQGYGNSLCGFRIIFTTEPGVVPHITKGEFIKEGASDMFRVAFPQVFSDDRWSRQVDLIPFE